jgi:thiamine kinase-like enzyme
LNGSIEERRMDKSASKLIDRFLNQVLETEVSLLPRKKQRALDEMELILSHYIEQAEKQGDPQRLEVAKEAKELLAIPANAQERPDLDALAEAWLDLIREAWYERLSKRRKFKPLRLKDIRRDLKDKPLESEKIVNAFSQIPSAQPIHTRVVSAIVGVPDNPL